MCGCLYFSKKSIDVTEGITGTMKKTLPVLRKFMNRRICQATAFSHKIVSAKGTFFSRMLLVFSYILETVELISISSELCTVCS